MSTMRDWQWPPTGPTPVNYGLDTEIFDSERVPHAQTFVREAIQNSLDARHDENSPVVVRFAFHEAGLDSRKQFIGDLPGKKQSAGMAWPPEWDAGRISWLVVEDSNSTGLRGDLKSRKSDFWNYWLNFGISNKSGAGRGGRGIGRITFLIASRISTVIGVTRRVDDGATAACGMSLLKPGEIDGRFMSSYAYLAKAPGADIYDLYDDAAFVAGLVDAFEITDYAADSATGLSLIIPYPHEKLSRDAIIAAAIEHFGPAIISGSLVVGADHRTVDASSIDGEAMRVAEHFPAGPLRDDPKRFLALIRRASENPDFTIAVEKPGDPLSKALGEEAMEKLRQHFAGHDDVVLRIEVPVTRRGKVTRSRLLAALSRAPKGQKPIDLFFREGMCLPDVNARNAADVDLVLMSNEGELATYLNFCEGKAHLGLLETSEVLAKLLENGFSGGSALKRFVRNLPGELRRVVLPDANKPDASIFSGFFSVPKPTPGKQKPGQTGKKDEPGPVPPPPPVPPAQPRIFLVDGLPDGFRVRANPGFTGWPVDVKLEVAYADGSRRPKWSRYDFEFGKLAIEKPSGVDAEIKNNTLTCRDCDSSFHLEVRGFDSRRELVTNVRAFRNA